MAKLTPLLRPVPSRVKVEVFTPTRWPLESNSGPPEFPELMAASVWTAKHDTMWSLTINDIVLAVVYF